MSCAPPPVMTMPRSMMSAASSGGVLSSVTFTASTIDGGRLLDRFADLRRCEMTIVFGQTGDEVASAHLGVELLLERPRARELHLHLFGGALTERERVLALHEVDDRFVELVAADAARLAHDDAAERDHRDLGGAAADVDDHVAGGLVHGEPGADRGGHGLLDHEHRLARAGELGGLLHRPPLDAR